MIYKVLVGNEHGGAAVASQQIIDYFSKSREDFRIIFLCNGDFALKNAKQHNNIILLNSYMPPIILASNIFRKILNIVNFLFWTIYSLTKFSYLVKKQKIKNIHTTNNHALLIVLLSKIINKNLFVISHWRCTGLASASSYKRLLRNIDLIICISMAVQESLPNTLKSKTVIIYDGIDTTLLKAKGLEYKGALRKQLAIEETDFVIGTIGSFTPIKCHELIIEAVSKCSTENLKIVLIGSCPNTVSEKYFNLLEKKILLLGLGDKVYLVKDKYFVNPSMYIQDFDLFIGATWNEGRGEGFGLIYVEAMSQSLPVVAIRVGAAEELITDHVTGFLMNSNSSDELKTIIEYSVSNKESIKEMGSVGLKRAKDFDVTITMKNLELLYLNLN